jgi:hypothetical protein
VHSDPFTQDVAAWFARSVPAGWFTRPPEVQADTEEILVVGELAPAALDAGANQAEASRACLERIRRFREDTRELRIRIAAEAEHRFRRKVSWGAACGGEVALFTTVSVPVMTRLRLRERAVLDTLIDAGVARSRSDALAWCVRLVGRHQAEWISDLRDALVAVKKLRAEGPDAAGSPAPR